MRSFSRLAFLPILLAVAPANARAALVVLPDIQLTFGIAGVDTNLGYGSYSTSVTNVTFSAGDVVQVTLLPEPGKRFHLEGTTGNTRQLSVIYNTFPFGTEHIASTASVTFNGLTGGAAPGPAYSSATDSVSGPAFDTLAFLISPSPFQNPDTIEFDSVTFSATMTNPTPISMDTNINSLVFSATEGELSQVPVPEPGSALSTLAGLALLLRRRRS